MANDMIRRSQRLKAVLPQSMGKLKKTITQLENSEHKTLLLGVSFALLDLVEQYSFDLKHTWVMETGGMKGRRKEAHEALHSQLKRDLEYTKFYGIRDDRIDVSSLFHQ